MTLSMNTTTQARVLKEEIAALAQFEASALRKGLFAAFGAYRRQRNEREAMLSALGGVK